MSERFVRLRPWPDQPESPGKRFRLEHEPGDNARLVEETVLPERVHSPDAIRRTVHESLELTTEDVRWLHEALGELLSRMGGDE